MFGQQAIRLIREKWRDINVFAEELYAVFQDKIPVESKAPITIRSNTTDAPLRLNQFGDGPMISFVGKHGSVVAFLDQNGYLRDADGRKKCHCRQAAPGPAKLDPIIIWDAIDDIWHDTALSGTQLNATAVDPLTFLPVAGTFTYTPASGTVLDIGLQNLGVLFTPTDAVTYNTATQTNQVWVNAVSIVRISSDFQVVKNSQPSFPHDVTIGNLIVIGVETDEGSTGVTHSVSDTLGNTYIQAGTYSRQADGGGEVAVSLWYAFSSSTGANTVSVTASSSVFGIRWGGAEYYGAAAFDGVVTASGGTGSAFTMGAISVSSDRELLVAVYGLNSPNAVADFDTREPVGGNGKLIDNVYELHVNGPFNSVRGGVSAAHTLTSSDTSIGAWAGVAATFTHKT